MAEWRKERTKLGKWPDLMTCIRETFEDPTAIDESKFNLETMRGV